MHMIVVGPTPILIVLGQSEPQKLMLIDALANCIVKESLKSAITFNGGIREWTLATIEDHLSLFHASR